MTQIEQIKAEVEKLYEIASALSGEYQNGALHTLITLKGFINSLQSEPQGLDELAEKYEEEHTIYRAFPGSRTEIEYDVDIVDVFKAGYMKGAADKEEKIIDKAAEWIKKNLTFMHPRKEREVCIANIGRFKDAMREE